MAQYGRIKYDIFFKRVFSQAPIVKAFLNTVLEHDLKSPIKTVSFEPTDFIVKGKNKLLQEDKHDVIDIFCTDEENRHILVELQKGESKHALPRFLDYQGQNYSSQFKTGDLYNTVVPCYSICWMFDLQPPHKELSETITLCSNVKTSDWLFDWKIKALYPRNLEWKKLLDLEKKAGKLEEWLLLDVVQDPKRAKKIGKAIQTQEVQTAFSQLDLSGYTEEEIREAAYRAEYKDLIKRDQKKAAEEKAKAVEEALKKATAIAMKKAAEEKNAALKAEKIALAKNLLDVLDTAMISQKIGLTLEEVEALKK